MASTVLGMFGGWLGGYIGMGTSLFIGFVLSIVGWYWAKYMMNTYLD